MSTNPKKFSDLIIELTETWLEWMPKNKLSHDSLIEVSVRRTYAEQCEKLINREYEIIEEIDKYFEKMN